MTERDLLADANRAERAGDPGAAALALRQHLARHPDDRVARLRFARLLIASGERGVARDALAPLAQASLADQDGLGREIARALAELDEAEGAIDAAARRWECLLADDIDDAQARAHLARLRPSAPPLATAIAAAAAGDTLASPEGVETLRYRLVRELGRGATATVYLARDEALALDVALKVLHPQLTGARQSETLGRFLAGARLLAGLRHPGLVAVYDVDERARALVMEWIPGGTLRARLTAHPEGLAATEVAATAHSLLSTLAFLHARGVVHGDLKPSNLLLRVPGEVVLADFGAAARIDDGGGQSGGTPLYLAPEQFLGAPASAETDLYAVGAILWETATGRLLRAPADLLHRSAPAGATPGRAPALRDELRARVPGTADLIWDLLDPNPSVRTRATQGAPTRRC